MYLWTLVLEFKENFMPDLSDFLLPFYLQKQGIAFKSSIYVHTLIIELS